MSTRKIHTGNIGGLGIFTLLAEGLSFRSGEPDAYPPVRAAPVQAPRRTMLDKVDEWFWRRHQRSVEMRLAKASDVFELERLIRGIERGDISIHG